MKGAITFKFDCEDADQMQAFTQAAIEAVRPITVVKVTEVVIQLNAWPGHEDEIPRVEP